MENDISITQEQADGTLKKLTLPLASQAESESGTESALRMFSPLRVAQAIAALGGSGGGSAITVARTIFVDPSGNDTTGEIGNPAKPFLTAQAPYTRLLTTNPNDEYFRLVLGVGTYSVTPIGDWNPFISNVIGAGAELTNFTINASGGGGLNGEYLGGPQAYNGADGQAGSAGLDGTVESPYGGVGGNGGWGENGATGNDSTDGGWGGNGKNIMLRADLCTCTIYTDGGAAGAGGGEGQSGGSGGAGGAGGAGGIGYTVVEGDAWNLSDPETYYIGYKFADGAAGNYGEPGSNGCGGNYGYAGVGGDGGNIDVSGTAIFFLSSCGGWSEGLGGNAGCVTLRNVVVLGLYNFNGPGAYGGGAHINMWGCLYDNFVIDTYISDCGGNHEIDYTS